jgi:hypothetical protein
MFTVQRLGQPMARRTMYRGIPMRSRLEARAAQFLDSIPGVGWAYEPVAYADETGQYLPDFEAIGLVDCPLLIEVKGAATRDEQLTILGAMRRIWSSLPEAGLAIWTGATIEEGAPFDIVRMAIPLEMKALRTCSLCARGLVAGATDWAAMFSAALCSACERTIIA